MSNSFGHFNQVCANLSAADNMPSPAPIAPREPINMIKWIEDPHFVGREDTLEPMRILLEEEGCVALWGAGGIGYVIHACLSYPVG